MEAGLTLCAWWEARKSICHLSMCEGESRKVWVDWELEQETTGENAEAPERLSSQAAFQMSWRASPCLPSFLPLFYFIWTSDKLTSFNHILPPPFPLSTEHIPPFSSSWTTHCKMFSMGLYIIFFWRQICQHDFLYLYFNSHKWRWTVGLALNIFFSL